MSNLEIFNYGSNKIRFVGTPENPEWVSADVVNVLYPAAVRNKNHSTYLSGIPNKWKGSKNSATPGETQEMTTLYEPDLYWLIARSNSPVAESFQDWLFEEVLPSIRKTGSYSINKANPTKPLLSLSQIEQYVQASLKRDGQEAAYEIEIELLSKYWPLVAKIKQKAKDTATAKAAEVAKYGWDFDAMADSSVKRWLRVKLLELPAKDYFHNYYEHYEQWCQDQRNSASPVDVVSRRAFSRDLVNGGAKKIERHRSQGWQWGFPGREQGQSN